MLPALIGAAANIAGGFINKGSQDEANRTNREMAIENIRLQKRFAQEGIRWKVEDARKAGIHPLYALGAQTTSFSPVSVGAVGDTSLGSGIAAAGQDLSRAVNATRTAPERLEARAVTRLQLEGLALDNDIKRATYASAVQRLQQNQNPPVPTLGPFDVPESKKIDERNPLMLDGNRVLTSPGTSPGKAWEDVLGDDLLSPGFLPNLIGMIKANTSGMSFLDILRALDRKTQMFSTPRGNASGGSGFYGTP